LILCNATSDLHNAYVPVGMPTSLNLGEVNLGEVNLGEVNLGEVNLGEVNLGEEA